MGAFHLDEVKESLQQYESEQDLFAPALTMRDAGLSREECLLDQWFVYDGLTVYDPNFPYQLCRPWRYLVMSISFRNGVVITKVACSEPRCSESLRKGAAPKCCRGELVKLFKAHMRALHKENAMKAKKYHALCWELFKINKDLSMESTYPPRLMPRVAAILEAFDVPKLLYAAHEEQFGLGVKEDEEDNFAGFLSSLQLGEEVPGVHNVERPLVWLVLAKMKTMVRNREEELEAMTRDREEQLSMVSRCTFDDEVVPAHTCF